MQFYLEANQLFRIGRPQIDPRRRPLRNRVNRRAALNRSHVHGGSWNIRQRHSRKSLDRAAEKNNGIRPSRIRPGMSARPRDRHQIPLTPQRVGHRRFMPGAIQNDVSRDAFARLAHVTIEMPHAAQIAFSFFADIAHEQNLALCLQSRMSHRSRHPQHRRHARAVVAGARSAQTRSLQVGFDRCPPGKNRIDMGREQSATRTRSLPRPDSDGIAHFVDVRVLEPQLAKALAQPLCPRSLAERRSRHCHHRRLPLQDSLLLQVQPLECLVHAAVGREPGDRCDCGSR